YEPQLYIRGILRLVPVPRRKRCREVLAAAGYTLRWWILGRLFSMAVLGILVGVGLGLLSVPMALTLALIAAALEFIPTIGPILASLPAILIAFMQGPQQALYVVLLYLAVQTVESYLLTPLVERQSVRLPPVMTILVMTLFGVLWGVLGVLVAAPATAAMITVVQMLYVEDTLGDRSIDVLGEGET
ncbi:MAG: AI-2E family transporter, partial [Planctomycetaceae bacterium]